MPRQSNGTDVQPANTSAVSSTTISSSAFNTLITDIYTEITNSLDRGGRSAMTANLPMGGNKITGGADPTVATDFATKNYTDTLTASFFSTGDVKFTIKTAADTGWVLFDDGTIGSATSGATSYANVLAQPLFNLIFNNISDTWAPILTSGGGATTRAAQTNAATAWAANCRISLPKALGRALAVAGSGSGLTARSVGQALGEETHLLAASEIPAIVASNPSTVNGTFTSTQTNVAQGAVNQAVQSGVGGTGFSGSPTSTAITGVTTHAIGGIVTQSTNTGGQAHNTMQPTLFLNSMIKL